LTRTDRSKWLRLTGHVTFDRREVITSETPKSIGVLVTGQHGALGHVGDVAGERFVEARPIVPVIDDFSVSEVQLGRLQAASSVAEIGHG
jgi:hypothetical protein